MNPPVIFIVDDDKAVRDGLSLLIESAGFGVRAFESAEELLAAFRPETTGCVILDVKLGGMSGPELHTELVRRGCNLPVIYLTAHGDIPMTVRAIKNGAEDFLTKPVCGEDLLDRVGKALERNRDDHQQRGELATRRQRIAQLTPREREILALVLAGQNNKNIARRLNISHRTVEIHRSHILSKTGKSNMLELAEFAAELRPMADEKPDPS
jgi:FixJ family two-component response regulator